MQRNRIVIAAACLLVVLSSIASLAVGATSSPTIIVTPKEGPVQTPAVITGSGFAPGASVDLVWRTVVGNDVIFTPVDTPWPLATVKADGTGAFQYAFKTPYDLGGPPHAIEARSADAVLAATQFTITRTATISPTSGPAGTNITVHMTGGGWTQYDNIVAVTYDNAFIGFMCAANSQGNMTLWTPATGDLGLHTIDVWPALYWGPTDGPTPWKIAHLADGDQPTKLPKFHLEFQLTDGVVAPANMLPKEGRMTVAQTPLSTASLLANVKASKTTALALSSGLLAPGSDLVIAGGGFRPGDSVKLTWSTVTVKTQIAKDKNKGWNATPVTRDLASETVDSSGTFVLATKVPYDFGGDHDIHAVVDGKTVAQTSLRIQPHFEFLGPNVVNAGEKVKIRGYGLGHEKYTAVWTVLYDNELSGWVSAYGTNGNATFEMYAIGAPGKHFIDIHEGSNGWPYLNLWESPWPWEPAAHYSFDIAGAASTTPAAELLKPAATDGGAKTTAAGNSPLVLAVVALGALCFRGARRGGR